MRPALPLALLLFMAVTQAAAQEPPASQPASPLRRVPTWRISTG